MTIPFYDCRSVDVVSYPDGTYTNGHWGGWEAWIGDRGYKNSLRFSVTQGVRTPDCPVAIDVINGYAYLNIKS